MSAPMAHTNIINDLGVFTGSRDALAKACWPTKTPGRRTLAAMLSELSDNGDAVVINRGRSGVEVILTLKNTVAAA
ncbi:hypothetical protein C6920_RS17730 [Escherichia coli]